jgi:MFS transporter, DHA3 family, tetracycline resistance protein
VRGVQHKLDAYAVYLIIEGAWSLFFAMIATINLVYQVEIARLNPLQLVLVGTMLEAVCFVCQVPTGALADAYSRRFSVITGMFLMGAGFMLEGFIPRFDAILVAQVLWGAGSTFVTGAEEAWIAGEVGEDRIGHTFLRGTQMAQLGGLVGAGISVALGSIRLNLPIVSGGALIAALGGFLVVAMPEREPARRGKDDHVTWSAIATTVRQSGRLVKRSPILVTILAVALFFGMSSEGFDRLNVAHFVTDFTMPGLGPFKPVVWFGVMMVGAMLLGLAGTEVVRRWLDTSDRTAMARWLLVLNTLMTASIVVFGLAGNFGVALVAFLVVSAARRTTQPIYVTWLTGSIEPGVRATVISMSGLVDSFGQMAGGPVIGVIGTLLSLRAAMVAAAVAVSPALVLFLRAGRVSRAAPLLAEEPTATRR